MVKSLHKIKNPKYIKLKEQHKNALFQLANIFNNALPDSDKKSDLDYVNELPIKTPTAA